MKNTIFPPTTYDMRSVIRFLRTEGNSTAQIHRPVYVLCNIVMTDEWWFGTWLVESLYNLKNGRTNVNNEEGQECKSIMTEETVNKFVWVISRFTISDISTRFSDISHHCIVVNNTQMTTKLNWTISFGSVELHLQCASQISDLIFSWGTRDQHTYLGMYLQYIMKGWGTT